MTGLRRPQTPSRRRSSPDLKTIEYVPLLSAALGGKAGAHTKRLVSQKRIRRELCDQFTPLKWAVCDSGVTFRPSPDSPTNVSFFEPRRPKFRLGG